MLDILFISFYSSCSFLTFLLGIGTAYGTAKSAVAIFHIGVKRPDLVMKMLLPVLMAGIIGLLGMVISLFLTLQCKLRTFYRACAILPVYFPSIAR